MKRKFPLSLTKNYVADWKSIQAIREILQNAIDQEATTSDNTMSVTYHLDTQELHVCNKSSILQKSSLLLGATTKADDITTIGHFGEGYKIATLVLLREDHPVTVYNYGAKEVWTARFVKKKAFDNAEVLTFEVDDGWPWTKVPDNNLTFVIGNITETFYKEIVESCLQLQDVKEEEYLQTCRGRILFSEKHRGNLYVNGLFVNTPNPKLAYGYDLSPEYLPLERDRRTPNSWDLQYQTTLMWSDSYLKLSEERKEELQKLITLSAPDVSSLSYTSLINNALAEDTYEELQSKYEEDIIPVKTQEMFEKYSSPASPYKPVIVSDMVYNVVASVSAVKQRLKEEIPQVTIVDEFEQWRDRYVHKSRALKEFNILLDKLQQQQPKASKTSYPF